MIIHVVKPGDNIYSISNQYNVPFQQIIDYNELTNPNQLVVGQTIVILDGLPDPKLGTFSVNGYAYPNIADETLLKTLPFLTYVTPFSYGFDLNGNLIPIDDNNIIAKGTAENVRTLMMVTTITDTGNFSSENAAVLLQNPSLQETLINNILQTLRAKNYYGIDIDFEFIPPELRQNYIDFIQLLRDRISPEGYIVLVALAPKYAADQRGLLYEAHDYAGLGAAADFVLIMTYEWGYTYGPPMAVAPINKVEEVVRYAVSEIPTEKIFMGIPNYGYDWTLPYQKGNMAKSIGNVEAVNLAARYNAAIEFDEVAKSPYFYYYDENYIQHVVWFEDARSIQAKLALANRYNLEGLGYWNIMKYFPQNWLVLNAEYNIRKV